MDGAYEHLEGAAYSNFICVHWVPEFYITGLGWLFRLRVRNGGLS
jgi:hypothetical protein